MYVFQKNIKQIILFILFLFFTEFLYSDNIKLEDVTLQLKWKHQFQFAGYYAAIEKGFYKEVGLNVKLLESPDNIEPAQNVLKGEVDFGIASSDLILLKGKGYPIVALAAIFQHSPLVFIALKTSSIDNIHNLVGKKVMLENHSAELLAYIKSEGISLNSMNFISHDFNPLALIENKVDVISAYSTDEPYLLFKDKIEYLTLTPRSSGIDFYGDTLFTTEEQIRKNPQKVELFLKASLKGWSYALKNSDEIIDIIYEKYSKRHTKEHLKFEAEQTKKLILPDVVEIGYMNIGRWNSIYESYLKLDMVPKKLSLKNFIYKRNPTDFTYLYLTIFIFCVIILAVSFVATKFYFLNKEIEKEIIERKKIEKNLEKLNSTKDKLFSIIGHDLRTPISNINSLLELIINGDFNENELKGVFKELQINTFTSLQLLENLLNWAKLQKEDITIFKEKIQLSKTVENVFDLNKINSKEKNIILESKIESNKFVYSDRNMLMTVLRNLIGNSIKFTNKTGKIIVELTEKDNFDVISVIDNGIGISPDKLDKLFILNETILEKGTNGETGIGLGLILCKEFVERNGGIISVESTLNIGTKFIFTLPKI